MTPAAEASAAPEVRVAGIGQERAARVERLRELRRHAFIHECLVHAVAQVLVDGSLGWSIGNWQKLGPPGRVS